MAYLNIWDTIDQIVLLKAYKPNVISLLIFSRHAVHNSEISGQWRRNEFKSGGAPVRHQAPEKKFCFFLVVSLHLLALKIQLVVLVSAFVLVSTVWSVSCLLFFYSRHPTWIRAVRRRRRASAADILLTPPPPIVTDRRAAAVAADRMSASRRRRFFVWRVHVMLYVSYMLLDFCNAVYNEALTLTKRVRTMRACFAIALDIQKKHGSVKAKVFSWTILWNRKLLLKISSGTSLQIWLIKRMVQWKFWTACTVVTAYKVAK